MMILIHWNFLFNKQNITPIEYGPHLKYSLELFLFNYINKNDNNRFSQISSLNNDKDESYQTH